MLKLIVDLTHYVDWSGNQQENLTEPKNKRKKCIFVLYLFVLYNQYIDY
jgi:hypothetical protein